MSNTQDLIEEPDHGITLCDGTRLSARIWRPANGAPCPAILEYLPYRKRDGTCARDALTHPYMARHGYVCVRVDIRGNGDSEGLMEDEYTAQELSDALEVIAYLAAQEWCSGSVGMMGISWGGFNALQVAALRPPALKAIITLCSTVDRFADDIHYKGGCLLNENLGWGATMWAYSSRAPDPALRPDWRKMWLERLHAEPFLPSVWLRHQRRDAYWQHGSVCEDYSAIDAKVLAVGGWGDAYKNAVPAIVDNIPGAKGIIGPWVHKYPHFAVPEPRIGFLQEALRWWDRWLRGTKNGAEDDPALRTYLMDGVRPATWYNDRPGRWLADPKITQKTLHLTQTGLGDSPAQCARAIASPQDTGAQGGEYCAIWLGPELPGDQRSDDARSACFDAPLIKDMHICGAPRVSLTLKSDQPTAQIAVRLCHVHPDGASTRITYGVQALRLRPGQTKDITLNLDHIAYAVPKGHRLRLAVSNAYWPLIWPSPHPATLTLTGGALTLPLTQSTEGWSFPPPDAAQPWQTETLREEAHMRCTEVDHTTGLTALIIEDDFGKIRDADHGLITSSIARERWEIHPNDPLSAKASCHWTEELERNKVRLRTEARCAMWSDATNFYLSARMEAFENDELVFERDETDVIPRKGL